jgi:hypothetical protein
MYKMLVDTCVWLDLVKDPNQQSLLGVIEELMNMGELSLIVPQIVVDEFQKNKARITDESSRSLSSHFKQVKEVVNKFGDPGKKQAILHQLNDLDQKIPLLGAAKATGSVTRIERLLTAAPITITYEVKGRAAQRAIEGRAPFHRNKNSIADAMLIEIYADEVTSKNSRGIRFAFVTHNLSDFSDPGGNKKTPHPDIAPLFSKRKSMYFISLAEAVHRVMPSLVPQILLEYDEWELEPRGLKEIQDAEEELMNKVWYNRHHNWLYKIQQGEHKIVEPSAYKSDTNTTPRDIFESARKSARRIEELYGLDNLGPWDDFEWGMLNGKLSALRWILGEEWDMLDT